MVKPASQHTVWYSNMRESRYPDAAQEAVSDITLNVRPGETIGIIGGTGSGKSSMVNLIPRFYDCSSGAVYVDGRNVCTYGLTENSETRLVWFHRNRYYLPEPSAPICSGANRMLRMRKFVRHCQIAQAKDVVESKKETASGGGRTGRKEFSRGQRQRFTIARALVKQPEILILDDSSSALDFATDAALRMAIGSMKHRPTLFIVSQRTSAIQYADKIVVLDDGSVVGIGTHEELMNTCEVYREIYDSQYKRTK